jgi:hypothetical protein
MAEVLRHDLETKAMGAAQVAEKLASDAFYAGGAIRDESQLAKEWGMTRQEAVDVVRVLIDQGYAPQPLLPAVYPRDQLDGLTLDQKQARNQAFLDTLDLEAQSPLASLFVMARMAMGERDPAQLRDSAAAGAAVAGVWMSMAAVQPVRLSDSSSSAAPQHEEPIRTAQSVVQAKVDEYVKDFHRSPERIADYLSPNQIDQLATAVEAFNASNLSEGKLHSEIGRVFGQALEARVVEWGKQEDLVSIGRVRDAQGRFTSSPDLLFAKGPFEGQRAEITTIKAWAAHAARDWGLDADVHYAGYEINYADLTRDLLSPRPRPR